jgi:DNA-binding NtrC family response regulator
LESDVADGRFRQDLYYRLNVHIIRVPPLRDRRSDVPELVGRFLDDTCARLGMPKKRIAPEALEVLMAYEWRRNNVRELRNIIERMIIATDADLIRADQVPTEVREGTAPESGSPSRTFQELKTEAERQIVLAALERNDWHITRAAEDLGLADHASLLKIMRRHHLKRP